MLYREQKLVSTNVYEYLAADEDRINMIKQELALKIALQMLDNGDFEFEIVDPKDPIPQSAYSNASQMEWENYRRRSLMEMDLVQFNLKINI
jgi:hypothetical protein